MQFAQKRCPRSGDAFARTLRTLLFPFLLGGLLLATVARADTQLPDQRLKDFYPGFAQIYDQLTPQDARKTETLRRFDAIRAAIDAYDPKTHEGFDAAWRALVTLYEIEGEKNLNNVFWLLDIGAIPPKTSGLMAQVRNHMVELSCEDVARAEGGELHRIDFSPATNAKNDIDQTLRPVDKLKQSGPELVNTFDATYASRFGIDPRHMDVVSHPFEARIPSWEADVEVHDFIVQLRRGSALLAGNEEAYFLEGAFRMQIDKRSFESDDKLYTIFQVNHSQEGDGVSKLDIADPRVPVEQIRDTAKSRVYLRIRPSAQRSYAFGSAVGNWYFYVQHGKGTRYACKYGLRSFAEGVGWLALPAEPDPNRPLPKTYLELLEAPVRREAIFDDVWNKYYEGKFDLKKKELKWALETALEIRTLGDQYNAEARARILGPRAQELGKTTFQGNEEVFLSVAEKQLNSHLQRMMIHNMEVCLPARLADYLEPKVSLRRLGYSQAEINEMLPAKRTALKEEARKRLRTSALFETLHALHVMDPEARAGAIERAKQRHPGFHRTLDALHRMAETKPVMLGIDIEERRQLMEIKKGHPECGKVSVTDEVALVRTLADEAEVKLAADVEELQRAVQEEAISPARPDAEARAKIDVIWELESRFDRAITDARNALSGTIQFATESPMRQVAINRTRKTVLESFGFEFRKDWRAVETIAKSDYNFNARTLLSNTLTLSNVDSLMNIIEAYRTSNGNSEVVGNAVLLEAVQRLPFVSQAIQLNSFVGGDLWAGGMLTVTVLVPELGPVIMVYGLAQKTLKIGLEIQTDRAVEAFYQGNVPNADGSPGPADSFYVSGGRVIGILEPMYEKLMKQRDEWYEQAGDYMVPTADRTKAAKLREAYTPDVEGAKRVMFEYYHQELERLFDRKGVPPERRLAMQLSVEKSTIMSNEPDIVIDRGNVPPMLKSYFGRVLEDFRHGRNEYAPWAAETRDTILKRDYFHTAPDPSTQDKKEAVGTDLVVVLADMFAHALINRDDPGVRPRLDLERFQAERVKCYFEGRKGEEFLPGMNPNTGEIIRPPDAPSLLAPYPGETLEERLTAFFNEHNKRLDDILRRQTRPKPIPQEEWTARKLGLRNADLRSVAAEEHDVTYSLLVAFFMSRIKEFWDLPIHHRDQGWLGDPLPNMDELRHKLAVRMAYDYKSALMAQMGIDQEELERKMQDAQFAHAVALERARAALLGGSETLADEANNPNAPPDCGILEPEPLYGDRDRALQDLALFSDDPHVFTQDETETGEIDFYAFGGINRVDPAARVEIVLPSTQMKEGSPLRAQCKVSATRHYIRPFQCVWSIEGASEPKALDGAPDSNLRFTRRDLGRDLPEGEYTISVVVTDSSEPPQRVGADAKSVRVKKEQEVQPQLSVELRGNYNNGPADGWADMYIAIAPWNGLLPEGDHYAQIRPHYQNKQLVLLSRIDCEAGTFLCAEGAESYDNKVILRNASLPFVHTGPTSFRLRIYTGNAEMPVLDQQIQVVVPAPALAPNRTQQDVAQAQEYAARARERAEKARQEYYQAFGLANTNPFAFDQRYDRWTSWFTEKKQAEWDLSRNLWTPPWEADHWQDQIQVLDRLYAELNGVYYFKKQNENFWRKTGKSGWAPFSHKPQLLLRRGLIDQADTWLASLEAATGPPPGPLYEQEKPYGEDMWVTYQYLVEAYLTCRLDPVKGLEVFNRLKAWGGTEGSGNVWENNKYNLEKAQACRAFFNPEAFR
ncbi:hypothetical protein JW916_12005 [Candidatus Sumerlaeota bacterium]|nr:hypothetical protein [Candidatus Sumerlaeota bacterium]